MIVTVNSMYMVFCYGIIINSMYIVFCYGIISRLGQIVHLNCPFDKPPNFHSSVEQQQYVDIMSNMIRWLRGARENALDKM